ncbi:MAG: hypothetical protein AAGA20_22530 [Planctomycetota bacterium]
MSPFGKRRLAKSIAGALLVASGLGLALREPDRSGSAIELRRAFERGRSVRIDGLEAPARDWLSLAWREMGVVPADESASTRIALVSSDLAPVPVASGVALHTTEDPEAPGRAVTFIVTAPDATPAQRDQVLFELAAGPPPTRPGTVALADPQPLPAADADGRGAALLTAAGELALLLGVDEPPTVARTLAPAATSAMGSTGRYAPSERALEVVRFNEDAELDALRAYARWVLVERLGPPADLWYVDGVVEDLVGSIEDRTDAAAERAALDVTFEEAIGLQPRTLSARRAAVRRLAQIASPTAAEREDVWRGGLDVAERRRLREEWDRARALDAATPRDRSTFDRRDLTAGVALRITPGGARGGYASESAFELFERAAALGFGTIVLSFDVPIAPSLADVTTEGESEAAGWGRSVTPEGDGAILAAAWRAADLGLAVILEPRFVTSPDGPLITQLDHPSPARIESIGRRIALAVEGVAHLAESARAEGLVLFEPTMLASHSGAIRPVAAAWATLRRQALAFARPFGGTPIGLAGTPGQLAAAVELRELGGDFAFGVRLGEPQSDTVQGAAYYASRLQVVREVAGDRLVLVQLGFDAPGSMRSDESAAAAADALAAEWAEGLGADVVGLSYWSLDAALRGPARTDASKFEHELLRALVNARK